MAGYVRQAKVYKLRFDDPEMNGLVVRMHGLTAGQLLETGRWSEDPEGVESLFRLFASKLVDWNLEEPEGVPVPTTYEAVLGQEDDLILAVIAAWQEAVAGVPAPLAKRSNGGGPSLVASLPMEPLSSSQAS